MIAYYHGVFEKKMTMRLITCNHYRAYAEPIFKSLQLLEAEDTSYIIIWLITMPRVYWNIASTSNL